MSHNEATRPLFPPEIMLIISSLAPEEYAGFPPTMVRSIEATDIAANDPIHGIHLCVNATTVILTRPIGPMVCLSSFKSLTKLELTAPATLEGISAISSLTTLRIDGYRSPCSSITSGFYSPTELFPVPNSLGRIGSLYLKNCVAHLGSLASLPSLVNLTMEDCHDRTTFTLPSLPRLQNLEMFNCGLSINSSIEFPALTSATLWDCDFPPNYLGKSPRLQSLHLSGEPIYGFSIHVLPKMYAMRSLTLTYYNGNIESFKLLPNLEILRLTEWAKSMEPLTRFPSLVEIYIDYYEGPSLEPLGRIDGLQYVSIFKTPLGSTLLEKLESRGIVVEIDL